MPRHKTKSTVTTLQNASSQSDSRLFSLAPELRNRIYELVFEGGQVRIKKTPGARGRTEVPGILMACKQAYAETLQLHFSMTTFQFYDRDRMIKWLQNIGPTHRSLLTRVDFCIQFRRRRRGTATGIQESNSVDRLKLTKSDLEEQQVLLPPGMLKVKLVCGLHGRSVLQTVEVELAEDGVERIVEVCAYYGGAPSRIQIEDL